ncbi:MAG: hypothetical protein EBZ07_02915 [Verrucomicrobia bacterium]|nr:hypothetical protein [Verrucomicrobiota bacterium]
MTIARIERLVRRVKGVLQGSETGGAQVAGEFAEVCREANRRLEECLASLRRGDVGGAMDLSEAEPALAEQIRTLVFAEFEAWTQRCREQGWMVPESADLRGFQGLQKALQEARGREMDPSLVEAFRAAMVAGDRPAALRTLGTILRRRPGDAWATAERGKLLAKESELSLRRIEALLTSGNDDALAGEVEKFDQLGLDAKYRPEIYEAARVRRVEVRQAQIQEKVREQLQQADALRAAGQWREVERILETASLDLEEAGARPPSGHLWNDLHQWIREKRVEVEKKEELQKQQERVDRELAALEDLRRDRIRRSASRLRQSLATVEEFLALPGTGGAGWPESVHGRLRKEAEALAADLRRARKAKWLLTALAGLGFGFTILGVLEWKKEEIRQEMFLREIDQMVAERKVDEAEAWLESAEAQQAQTRAHGAAELKKLRTFLEAEKQARDVATAELSRLEQLSLDRKTALGMRWGAWAELEKKLSTVHPRWKSALEERKDQALAGLRAESREFVESRARTLRGAMKRVELEFAGWESSQRNQKEDANKLQSMTEQLQDGVTWRDEGRPELAMPPELEKEWTALISRLVERRAKIEEFHLARQALAAATSPAEYRSALERLAAHPGTEPSEKEKISQVVVAWRSDAELMASLWLAWENPAPAGLRPGSGQLFPKRLESSEEKILRDIVEDDFLGDVWSYDVPVAKDSKQRYLLYSLGRLKVIPGSGSESPYTYGQGEVFIPGECARDEPVKFEKRPRSEFLQGIRQDSEKLLIGFGGQVRAAPEPNSERLRGIWGNLEKALSGDSTSLLSRAPVQEALEALLPASPGVSPLARAYLSGKIWKLVNAAGDPCRFGLVFSPSLRKVTSAWSSWGAVEPGLWLKNDVQGLDADWIQTFSLTEAPSMVEEAKLFVRLWILASQAGLPFGGWVDGQGKEQNFDRLVNLESGQILLGQGKKGELVVGWRYEGGKWVKANELRPFSPLYLLPRSPKILLGEAARAAKIPDDKARALAKEHLPFLFGEGS